MKKIILLITLIILLSGCSKTITCETKNSDNDINITYKLKYNEDTINNIILEKIYKFDTKKELEDYKQVMTYTVKKDTQENVKVSYKKKNKKHVLTYKFNIENMTQQELQQNELKRNKDEQIEYLKNKGFTCR